MRNSFVKQTLTEMGRNDKIVLFTGDLGYRALEPIRDQYPDRFINAGAAEANMVGVAAGFALTGYIPLVYSIAPFVTMRCFEQIRVDVCYHNLNVKFIGIGGGVNYGNQGITHHAIEDLAVMRSLPEMKVLCPASAWEAEQTTKAIINTLGPAYIRVGIKIPEEIHQPDDIFTLGKGYLLQKGSEVTLINTGNTLTVAFEVVELLKDKGISTDLLHLPTVKPLDEELIITSAQKTRNVFTIEEASVIGGLGSAVGDLILENGVAVKHFKKFALPDKYLKAVGSPTYLRKLGGLDSQIIADYIVSIL